MVVDSSVPATAILTHTGGQSYVLETKEYHPFLGLVFREMTITLKITPSGRVMFAWPDEWLELVGLHADITERVKLHTGYDIQGPGINKGILDYKGFLMGKDFMPKSTSQDSRFNLKLLVNILGSGLRGLFNLSFHWIYLLIKL